MIEGVMVKNLKIITDQRGWLMEIMRNDDPQFKQFGQVYLTTAKPGVVKAWHYHKIQTDNFTCVFGIMQVALYDARKDSPTFGKVQEFIIDSKKPILLTVPPGVYHGFKAVSETPAYFLSVPTEAYNYETPDEYRLAPDTDEIPFKWELDPNLTHG